MNELVSASGYVLFADGDRWVLADQRTRGLAVATFVLGLISVIFVVPIGVTATIARQGNPGVWSAVAVVGGVWVLAVVAFVLAVRAYRRRARTPGAELPVVVIIDHAAGVVVDGAGVTITPIAQARVAKRLRIGSSSPSVHIEHPGGLHFVADGHPFLGGAGPLIDGLTRALSHRPG